MFVFYLGNAKCFLKEVSEISQPYRLYFDMALIGYDLRCYSYPFCPKREGHFLSFVRTEQKKEGEGEKERERESAFFINSKGKRGYFRFLFLFFFFFSLSFFSFPGSDGYDYRLWLFSRFPPPEIGGLLIAKAEFFESYIRQSSN